MMVVLLNSSNFVRKSLEGILLNCTQGMEHVDVQINTGQARRNVVRLLYAHESWWDEHRVEHFASRITSTEVRIYEVSVDNKSSRHDWKNSIRKELQTATQPSIPGHLHVPDREIEESWIRSVVHHGRAEFWLENCPDFVNDSLARSFREWRIELSNHRNPENLVVVGAAGLAAWGLLGRETHDIDYIHRRALERPIPNRNFDCHNDKDWVHIPEGVVGTWTLNYKGALIANPEVLIRQKMIRYRERGVQKDHDDASFALRSLDADSSGLTEMTTGLIDASGQSSIGSRCEQLETGPHEISQHQRFFLDP